MKKLLTFIIILIISSLFAGCGDDTIVNNYSSDKPIWVINGNAGLYYDLSVDFWISGVNPLIPEIDSIKYGNTSFMLFDPVYDRFGATVTRAMLRGVPEVPSGTMIDVECYGGGRADTVTFPVYDMEFDTVSFDGIPNVTSITNLTTTDIHWHPADADWYEIWIIRSFSFDTMSVTHVALDTTFTITPSITSSANRLTVYVTAVKGPTPMDKEGNLNSDMVAGAVVSKSPARVISINIVSK